MKMTMHIDERILDEVMAAYGCASKTEAVDFALRELVRKRKLRAYRQGIGLTPAELGSAILPDYDPLSLRVAEPPPHGKRRPRR